MIESFVEEPDDVEVVDDDVEDDIVVEEDLGVRFVDVAVVVDVEVAFDDFEHLDDDLVDDLAELGARLVPFAVVVVVAEMSIPLSNCNGSTGVASSLKQ